MTGKWEDCAFTRRAGRPLNRKRHLRRCLSRLQLADTLVQFLVYFRETMVEAKVVRPGRRAECLCPLHGLLQVALKHPVPSTDAAVDMHDIDLLCIDRWRHRGRQLGMGHGLPKPFPDVGAGGFRWSAAARRISNGTFRRSLSQERLMKLACLACAACSLSLALTSSIPVAALALALGGAGWVTAWSGVGVSVQLASPRWVVGRPAKTAPVPKPAMSVP